jgi:anti-sigma regulatory factor (Ser/Thr protein kinase)
MENKLVKHFVIRNNIGELPGFAEKVEELAEEWNLPLPLTMNLNLVLEEALSNIIFYAFTDDKQHDIKITIAMQEKTLVIRIADKGIPFDPTARQQPDITLPAEERPIGGLGILLILKMMDQVHYARIRNQNVLTLTKNI